MSSRCGKDGFWQPSTLFAILHIAGVVRKWTPLGGTLAKADMAYTPSTTEASILSLRDMSRAVFSVGSRLPDKKNVLSSGRNDLANNVVGCISLYEDVKNAWAEIKSNASILQYLQTQKGLKISDTLPSQTEN